MNNFHFDIETTGFNIDTNLVSFAWINKEKEFVTSCNNFVNEIDNMCTKIKNQFGRIVTFNGDNFKGGFDFPYLRTFYLLNQMEWPFKGIEHLDILPLVEKFLNTNIEERSLPSKSSLRKNDLVKLAKANDLEYETIPKTYKKIMELEKNGEANWLNYSEYKSRSNNDLQSVYQILFDPNKEEVYVDGGKVPELYEEIKELQEKEPTEEIINRIAYLNEKIEDHNLRDVQRLQKVTEKLLKVMPDYYINRNTTIL